MTGIEYTERLIDDINRTIELRNNVPDPFTQIRNLRLTSQHSIENFMASLNVTQVDAHLDNVSQFINLNERLVNHNKGDRINIETFIENVITNKNKIANVFQELLDNKELTDPATKTPIGNILVEQLDYIHESSTKGA